MELRVTARVGCRIATYGCVASLYAGLASAALAQVGSIGGGGSVPPVSTGRADVFAPPGRAEHALIVGDWLLYPSAFGGVLYDTNTDQRPGGSHSSAGFRF